jgi:ABC-2 type transport system permease protein
MFGYALNLEIQKINIAVVDFSRSPQSQNLVEQFRGSKFFEPFYYLENISNVDELFKKRKAHVVLIIPADFALQLNRQTIIPLQFIIDAADANAATFVRQYCNRVVSDYSTNFNRSIPLPFGIESTILFNPLMKSSYFFVPGLMALLLVMISALLTSIAITREKETGTLEQILVSPVQPLEIIVGKVLPYIFLAILSATTILVTGIFLFKVPFEGNLLLLLILTSLYIITALSLGILISTVAQTQQVAMMIALSTTLLPTILLSGFIFPLDSMPALLQWISYIVPARFYLHIVRGIILKGSSFSDLLPPTFFLTLMSIVLLFISSKKFSMDLEK